MNYEITEKWEPIQNIDITRRTPEEWAKIYNVKLVNNVGGWWDEYEWAYNFDGLAYLPNKFNDDKTPDWESISEKELRAAFIKRDLYLGADMGEKEVLKTQYIETNWVRNHKKRV